MTSLAELKARVEAATGPDRELDGDIVLAMGGPPETALPFQADVAWKYRGSGEWVTPSPRCIGFDVVWKCPAYTASLDAALALVEATTAKLEPLVGVSWGFDNDIPGVEETPRWNAWCYGHSAEHPSSPALALLAALLSALEAQP